MGLELTQTCHRCRCGFHVRGICKTDGETISDSLSTLHHNRISA